MGKVRNMMLQVYATLVRGLTCFKRLVKHLAKLKIKVFKIPPGIGGAKSDLTHGLKYIHPQKHIPCKKNGH